MLYYCNTVGVGLVGLRLDLMNDHPPSVFDTVGSVTGPVKISSPNDLYCVEWDVKPNSTQPMEYDLVLRDYLGRSVTQCKFVYLVKCRVCFQRAVPF